jgi:DNA mismatch repair ATPase MutS
MRQFWPPRRRDPLHPLRLGDFMSAEDAVTAKALSHLTSRNKSAEEPDPMVDPYHAANRTCRGCSTRFKVAICEQMWPTVEVKGIVPRAVSATPSMPFDDGGIEARKNLFLGAVEDRWTRRRWASRARRVDR